MNVDLDTLFGSRRKLALLRALFCAEGPLTAAELARRSAVSLPQTVRILREYVRSAAATESEAYPKNVYRLGDQARQLLAALFAQDGLCPEETSMAVVQTMVSLGAPLMVHKQPAVALLNPEFALPYAVRLSRQDPALLSTLPVVVRNLWRRHPEPSFWNAVRQEALHLGVERHTGMLLELVGHLLQDNKLTAQARRFACRRERRSLTAFRGWYRNRWERTLAEKRTPKVARSWGFLMNTDEADFRHHLGAA